MVPARNYQYSGRLWAFSLPWGPSCSHSPSTLCTYSVGSTLKWCSLTAKKIVFMMLEMLWFYASCWAISRHGRILFFPCSWRTFTSDRLCHVCYSFQYLWFSSGFKVFTLFFVILLGFALFVAGKPFVSPYRTKLRLILVVSWRGLLAVLNWSYQAKCWILDGFMCLYFCCC